MKKIALICVVICLVFIYTGCEENNSKAYNVIDIPDKVSTYDEAMFAENPYAVEDSSNVNGKRYNITLDEFSLKYNEMLKEAGCMDTLNSSRWKKTGKEDKDTNGVAIQYYYYDADRINLTATVEAESGKIMNMGVGTTMSTFVSVEKDKNYSDTILMKCGIMAAAVGGFSMDDINILQDVFYRTTFDNSDEIWYKGNVFCLSTSEDKGNSERSTMLFRIFPIKEELKKQWDLIEYDEIVKKAS